MRERERENRQLLNLCHSRGPNRTFINGSKKVTSKVSNQYFRMQRDFVSHYFLLHVCLGNGQIVKPPSTVSSISLVTTFCTKFNRRSTSLCFYLHILEVDQSKIEEDNSCLDRYRTRKNKKKRRKTKQNKGIQRLNKDWETLGSNFNTQFFIMYFIFL